MEQVRVHNDEKAWREFFFLPKAVLRSADRGGGKRGRDKAEAETKDRAKAWLEGKRGALWAPPRAGKSEKNQSSEGSTAVRRERAVELAKEGLFSKACSALLSSPPVEVTDEVEKEMRAKHPAPRPEETSRVKSLRDVSKSAASQVTPEIAAKAIRDFPRGSAGGPSGLRPQHLKDALVPGWADEVARELALLVNAWARGEVPVQYRQYLAGASLSALPKPNGPDLRPVAVGETVRRCAAKALWEIAKEEAKARLEPIQMGVGTLMGAETLVHVVRDWLFAHRENGDKVLAMLDLSNAFNAVDRSAVRRATRAMMPGLALWVDTCYGSPSSLVLGGRQLRSERGVQQGDPLGPALFSMAIHEAIEQATRKTKDKFGSTAIDLANFYLDDGMVAGSAAAVLHWLT
jgi:hypothetical protein